MGPQRGTNQGRGHPNHAGQREEEKVNSVAAVVGRRMAPPWSPSLLQSSPRRKWASAKARLRCRPALPSNCRDGFPPATRPTSRQARPKITWLGMTFVWDGLSSGMLIYAARPSNPKHRRPPGADQFVARRQRKSRAACRAAAGTGSVDWKQNGERVVCAIPEQL